jgi:hypothetical protein
MHYAEVTNDAGARDSFTGAVQIRHINTLERENHAWIVPLSSRARAQLDESRLRAFCVSVVSSGQVHYDTQAAIGSMFFAPRASGSPRESQRQKRSMFCAEFVVRAYQRASRGLWYEYVDAPRATVNDILAYRIFDVRTGGEVPVIAGDETLECPGFASLDVIWDEYEDEAG